MSETTGGDLPADETVLLAAFEGWNDAGSAATQALEHLHDVWGADQVDELDPEEYHDFQVNRPQVGPGPDGTRGITWPTTAIAVATTARGRTVVLVHGIEPSMRWRRYCDEVLTIAASLGVRTVVTIGALLADVPHTRPIPVTATSEDAVLRRLEQLLGEPIPLGELPDDAAAWQDGVDELAGEDGEIGEYVRQLEEAKDTADLPEASGEAIAQEFERYLRRRDPGLGG